MTIDFTVNGEHELSVEPGTPLVLSVSLYNADHRNVSIDVSVELDGATQGAGTCRLGPVAICVNAFSGTAAISGSHTAVAHITATVDGCGACPALSANPFVMITVGLQAGDFNCSNTVNSIDAALILQLTAGLIQPFPCTGAGDANGDGYTNAIDATLVLQYVAGLITSFT